MYKVTAYYKENILEIERFQDKSKYTWTEHLYYTRNAIISILAGLPDVTVVSERLIKNQDDIGYLLKHYYNPEQVTDFVNLLKRHITLATEFTTASKAKTDVSGIRDAWYANGADIVNWMNMIDPTGWPAYKMGPLWNEHITRTIVQIESRVAESWAADIAALDAGHNCINLIAQEFALGVVYNNIPQFSTKAN
jgi:hypothetical protein